MQSQAELIHNTDFDTLLILDATRYDIFKQVNTLKGKLTKVRSNAQHTQYWLQRTFPHRYNWTYLSAHPYITKTKRQGLWNATDHFKTVHELWRTEWNDGLGTVHPDRVGIKTATIPYTKAIIHYLQPHGPWIGKHKLSNAWALDEFFRTGQMADGIVMRTQPDPVYLKLAYKDNLRLVLNSIKKFREHFKGKVIITADHGEMLGEKGYYLHKERYHKDKENPDWVRDTLQTVPWFELD